MLDLDVFTASPSWTMDHHSGSLPDSDSDNTAPMEAAQAALDMGPAAAAERPAVAAAQAAKTAAAQQQELSEAPDWMAAQESVAWAAQAVDP